MMFSIKTLQCLTVVAAIATANPVKRNSPSWAGTNNYFLHGLSSSDQSTYINTLASVGVKVVRLWVTGIDAGCQKYSTIPNTIPQLEPTSIGSYDDTVLDALDATIVQLAANGIKVIISPHDGNVICGSNGKDVYCNEYGPGYFYEEQTAFDAYDNRLNHILNYQGATSGQVWKNWNAAIFAFDVENEPFSAQIEDNITSDCNNNDPDEWFCGRASYMRSVLGADNPIKIASGGIGGDISHNCNFMPAALDCAELDLISVHRYAGGEASNPNQWSNSAKSWVSQSNGKNVYIEEWGVDVNTYNPSTEFPANTEDMNSVGIPWIYWQVLPHETCSDATNDGFGIFIDSGVDFASQYQAASSETGLQDWTGSIY